MFEIGIIGLEQAISGLTGLAQNVDTAVERAMIEGADNILSTARADVHVVSGRLRGSLRITGQSRNEVRGGSTLDYAGIEEYRVGGRKPSHEYLRPAIDANLSIIYQNMIRAISSALR